VAMSNAERQRRYITRLKDRAAMNTIKLNDTTEQMLRASYAHYEHLLSQESDAVEKIIHLIGELVKFHGAKAVVIWLKARSPLRPEYSSYGEDHFLMDVLRMLPRRGGSGRGSLSRVMLDACDELDRELRKSAK